MVLAAPLALGALHPLFLGVAAAGAVALLGVLVVDYQSAARDPELEVRRQHHPRLYLAAENRITLSVTNRSARPVRVWLRDTPPEAFQPSTYFLGDTVGAGATAELAYVVRPAARGRYRFGDLYLRWRTPGGLLWRQRPVAAAEELPVYPNLLAVEHYELLARRGLLHELGLRSVRRRGEGTAFESLREYQPDDDYRRINWPATARRHQPITTLYQTERNQRLVILLDLGRMMLTRVGELSRLDHAVNAALLLSYVALRRGDRVGLIGFADGVQRMLPPRSGRAHFYAIVEQLYAVRAQPVEADYAAAFTRLRSVTAGRSLVVLFTDLNDAETARSIARFVVPLARHHLPLCVTLSDPAVEARADRVPASGRELYEKVVAARLLEDRDTLLDELRRAGGFIVDAPADRLTPASIDRYLALRDRFLP
jgi:uncharacterized protein (DUF58 family)